MSEKNKTNNLKQDLADLESYILDIRRFLPVPTAYVNPLGVIMDVDQALQDLSGYLEDEIIGKTLVELSRQQRKFEEIQKMTLKKGSVKNQECTIINKAGEEITVSVSTLVRKDANEEAIGYFISLVDVTEQRRLEEALRGSEERYRAIFEQAADSIVLIDVKTGALVEFNAQAHQNLGYTREEFKKLKIPDFEVIESSEEVAKHIQKIIRDGSGIFETKHRTKNGEIRNIRVSSRAVSIAGRNFVQSIWSDITDSKRAEERLKEKMAELEEFHDLAVGRELKMIELEKEIERLKDQNKKEGKS